MNIIEDKKNYSEGEVTEYINKSQHRVKSICPHFNNCGGCTFIDIDYNEQLIYKQEKIKELIDINKINTLIKPIIKNENQFNYRNKAVFHVKKNIGYYQIKSYQIEPIEKCYIVNEKINESLSIIRQVNYNILKDFTIRYSEYSNELMLILDNHLLSSDIATLKQYFSTIVVKKGNRETIISGSGYIIEKLGDYLFKISPSAFFQVNTKQTEKLYQQVLNYANPNENDIVLDLYCGTGTIGLYISNNCKKIIGIEINKDAIKDAKYNAKLNNINNAEFIANDSSNINQLINIKPDIIVVDPPRSGLTNKVIDYLLKAKSKKIVYVSCDPMTLMRDLKLLTEVYEINEITPVDMFPNTYHVECVAELIKKEV